MIIISYPGPHKSNKHYHIHTPPPPHKIELLIAKYTNAHDKHKKKVSHKRPHTTLRQNVCKLTLLYNICIHSFRYAQQNNTFELFIQDIVLDNILIDFYHIFIGHYICSQLSVIRVKVIHY